MGAPVAAVAVTICGVPHSVVVVRRNGERDALFFPQDIEKLRALPDDLPTSALKVPCPQLARPQVY